MFSSIFSSARKSGTEITSQSSSHDEAMTTTSKPNIIASTYPQMTTAQCVDAHFDELAEVEAEKRLHGEEVPRKMDFSPDIRPVDEKWIEFKETIVSALAAKSVTEVLKSHHENGDDLLLIPARPGWIRNLQKKNAKYYRKYLALGGRFHEQPDNLVTKLIMTHFGFPVAPITINNITNAGRFPDNPDTPDSPLTEPRIQRIQFSEKPLDFLHWYNERSFGWKVIRRKTPSRPTPTGIFKRHRRYHPQLRGGAGPSKSYSPELRINGYIYSHLGGRARVTEDVESFVQASLTLLGIDPDSEWLFIVEKFDNRAEYQNQPWNPSCPENPWIITKEDTSAWDNKICALALEPHGDWRMAVRLNDGKSTPSYLCTTIVDGVGKLDDQTGEGQEETPIIWALHDPDDPENGYKSCDVDDDSLTSFIKVSLDALKLHKIAWVFQIGLYAPDTSKKGVWNFRSNIELNSKDDTMEIKYKEQIASNLFPRGQKWAAIVLRTEHTFDDIFYVPEDELNYGDGNGNDKNGKTIDKPAARGDGEADLTNNSSPGQNNIIEAFADGHDVTSALETKETFIEEVLPHLEQLIAEDWSFSVHRYSYLPTDSTARLQHSFVFDNEYSDDEYDEEVLLKSQIEDRNWLFIAQPNEEPALQDIRVPYQAKGKIYGYAGQFNAVNDERSIIETIHSLLRLNETDDWYFMLDVHLDTIETFNVTDQNYSDMYEKVIRPSIKNGEQWPIFVRKYEEPLSISLEPRTLDVIYLLYEPIGIAYWKVPRNMDVGYGINQPQVDFRRAMDLFFPNARPAQNVTVAKHQLGFGSIDLTTKLWDQVQEETSISLSEFKANQARDPMIIDPVCLQFGVALQEVPKPNSDVVAVRYVGSSGFGQARIPMMAQQIENVARNTVADKRLPKEFRVWLTAQDRLYMSDGEKLKFGASAANIEALENWYHSTTQDTPATCLEFSAEWEKFELFENEGAEPIHWTWNTKSGGSTLHSFRDAVKNHYGDRIDLKTQSIKIYEPQSDTQFILACDADEKQWRVNVYDWLTSPRLQIQPIGAVKYEIDLATPWALPGHALATRWPKTTTKPGASGPNRTTQTSTRLRAGFAPPKPAVKFNKDRVNHHFRIGRKVPLPWHEFAAGEAVLDKLQHSTYLTPQPIMEPGLAPDAPLFAESRELALAVSQNTPTAYASVLTPTDVRHLREQNRRLQNQHLERSSSCQMCNATFEAYKTKEEQEHYDSHKQAIASAGVCVLCEDKNWKFWSAEEKRQHLYEHQARDEGRIAKKFWAGFKCPGCDVDLAEVSDKDDVLKHAIAHDSQTVKYCDRCSKSYTEFSAAELEHHDRVCTKSPERKPEATPPVFCKGCGINKTNMTEAEDKLHSAIAINCFTKDAFCYTCGFGMTGLTPQERDLHIATCKTPGGPAQTYCCRCGGDLANLEGHTRGEHSQFCKSSMNMEPEIIRQLNARLKEINEHIHTNLENDAKRRKANWILHQREIKVKAMEVELVREKELLYIRANPGGANSTPHTPRNGLSDTRLTPDSAPNGLFQSTSRGSSTTASPYQQRVESFVCPLTVLAIDGTPISCGKRISLLNGGVELMTHYQHPGAGVIHRPNSIRAQQMIPSIQQTIAHQSHQVNERVASQRKRPERSRHIPISQFTGTGSPPTRRIESLPATGKGLTVPRATQVLTHNSDYLQPEIDVASQIGTPPPTILKATSTNAIVKETTHPSSQISDGDDNDADNNDKWSRHTEIPEIDELYAGQVLHDGTKASIQYTKASKKAYEDSISAQLALNAQLSAELDDPNEASDTGGNGTNRRPDFDADTPKSQGNKRQKTSRTTKFEYLPKSKRASTATPTEKVEPTRRSTRVSSKESGSLKGSTSAMCGTNEMKIIHSAAQRQRMRRKPQALRNEPEETSDSD